MAEIAHKTKIMKTSVDELQEKKKNELKTTLASSLEDEIKVLKDMKKVAKVSYPHD